MTSAGRAGVFVLSTRRVLSTNTRVGVKYFWKYLSHCQVQVLFHICKYKFKYSKYLGGIKYTKYFFNQVQVPSTLVTNNDTVSLDPKLISAVTVVKFQF